ncbi:hypothetical protein COO60DRAFT_741693 [Scenedesmus sp. NREL 46B-D3]|nr:hypothetical protein COO60DRAFT_741693 [Scenedesmus sp. NREL 46B-D3]
MPPKTASTPALAFFTDVEQFRPIALPLLASDTTFNTLALTALLSVTAPKPGMVLGLLTNSSNSSSIVLVCPGLQGIGCQLYVAPAPTDEEAAKLIAQQLPNLSCTTTSTTSAGAALLQQYCGWPEKHRMHIMLYQPEDSSDEGADVAALTETSTTTAASRLAAGAAADTGYTGKAATAAYAAAAGLLAHSTSSWPSSIPCTAALTLRSCSPDKPADVQLVLEWAGEFLAQAFHLASAPPAPQLQAMVLPRLQQGLYYLLHDSSAAAAAAAPVCMACHVPTSSDSTRVTMLFTPAEQRGRGYGRQTMRQLCNQLVARGYRRICLMADQAEPAVKRLYQGVGFVAVGDMVMLERCSQQAAEADQQPHERS